MDVDTTPFICINKHRTGTTMDMDMDMDTKKDTNMNQYRYGIVVWMCTDRY